MILGPELWPGIEGALECVGSICTRSTFHLRVLRVGIIEREHVRDVAYSICVHQNGGGHAARRAASRHRNVAVGLLDAGAAVTTCQSDDWNVDASGVVVDPRKIRVKDGNGSSICVERDLPRQRRRKNGVRLQEGIIGNVYPVFDPYVVEPNCYVQIPKNRRPGGSSG